MTNMTLPCAQTILGQTQQTGRALLLLMLLAASADEDGVSQISHEALARRMGYRQAKSIGPILRKLEESGDVICAPGTGRGHVSRYLVTAGMASEDAEDALVRTWSLSREEARARVQEIIRRRQGMPTSAADAMQPSSTPPEGSVPAGSLGASPPAIKGDAEKPPLAKGPLQEEPLQEGPLQKGPLHKGPLRESPLVKGQFPPPKPAEMAALDPKSPSQKGPLQKPPLHKGPLYKGSLQEGLLSPSPAPALTLDHAPAPTRERARGFAVAVNNHPIQEKYFQQQQKNARRFMRRDPAPAREALLDAFRTAGIKNPTAQRIPAAWEKVTGRALTPEDVLAWHFQRQAENRGRAPERHMGVGAVIRYLEAGEPADEAFYDQAREFLLGNGVEPAVQEAPPETSAEREARELVQALTLFLPPIVDVGPQARDEARARLPDIARGLASHGVSADEVHDLHLYFTHTQRPIPRPEAVGRALGDAGRTFRDWRQRRAGAERLWRQIVTQLNVGPPASAAHRLMQQARAIDLADSLVVMADPSLEDYFRRAWRRQGPGILSLTDFPDIPIHFVSQQKSR